MRPRLSPTILLLAATINVIVVPTANAREQAADRKEADPPPTNGDANKLVEKQLDWMKDLAGTQKDMFQHHLNTITLIAGLAVLCLTIMQWRADKAERKREQRLAEEQRQFREEQNKRDRELHDEQRQMRMDRLEREKELYAEQRQFRSEQGRRESDVRARDASFDRQIQSYIDQAIKYTQNSSGLIEQMKAMLEMNKESQELVSKAKIEIDMETQRRDQEAEKANAIAKEFLEQFSISDDGFASALRDKWSEINFHRVRGSDDKVSPHVPLIEGLFEWIVNRNTGHAEKIWLAEVLKHSDISKELRLKARTEYCLGLALTQHGRYADALVHLHSAAESYSTTATYQMAILQARIYHHRGGKRLAEDELEATRKELRDLWNRLASEGDAINLGSMKVSVFRVWLGYTYGAFLTHELGNNEERLAEASDIVRLLLENPLNRSAELDGVRCAIAVKTGRLTLAEIEDYLQQCEIDLIAATDDKFEEFTHNMRKARLLGRRAALKRVAQIHEGAAADDSQMSNLVNLLRGKLARMKRVTPDATIYSPFTRIHEPLSKIDEQLTTRFTVTSFDGEVNKRPMTQ
jgi:hypothetical protein